jgi:AcrR family transcriptional regulator
MPTSAKRVSSQRAMRKTEIKHTDKRIQRTHERLRAALVSLILERGWDDVSVMDVCDKAEVGRSTFYIHFADKEDLLVSGFDQLLEHLQRERRRAEGTFAFADALIVHASENVKLFRALVGRKSGQVVQRRMRDVIYKVVEAELASLGFDPSQRNVAAKFVSGGLFELLIGWLEASRRSNPNALVAAFQALTKNALGLTKRGG